MIGAFPLKLLGSEKIANKRLRWIRGPKPQARIDRDPVDEVIDHCGDAVNTAEPLIKASRILSRHWPLLLFLKAGKLDTIASVDT
jgi:hypothetical protein